MFLALYVTFCLCMKYLGNRRTDLRQIHRKDVFSPDRSGELECQGQTSKIKVTRDKKGIFSISAACIMRVDRSKSMLFDNANLYWPASGIDKFSKILNTKTENISR